MTENSEELLLSVYSLRFLQAYHSVFSKDGREP